MSVVFELDDCKLIEQESEAAIYAENGVETKFKLSEKLFMNFKRKCKSKLTICNDEIELKNKIMTFLTECKKRNLFQHFSEDDIEKYKQENIKFMNSFYSDSIEFKEFHGENNLDVGVITTLNDGIKYLIPKKCTFFNKKVEDIEKFLPSSKQFDFIVIDPPWNNRYIKRLKKNNRKQSYNMLTDEEIMNIPIENHTHRESIVIIWSTNSQTHQNAIEQKFLEKWKLKIIAKWKWVKLDKHGELFTSFDGSKKPYEIVYVCSHVENLNPCESIPESLVIFSHPSSIHSHKPPLIGI